MIHTIKADSPDEGLLLAIQRFRDPRYYVERKSRNGPVREFNGPCMTEFSRPEQRVSFGAIRDANPFFHLFEAMWMLVGNCDVETPAYFAGNIKNYADEEILHGAYGNRWRNHFHVDQIEWAAQELIDNPDNRRVVVSMWDPEVDIPTAKLDHPCNTSLFFYIRDGRLDMTVNNRSNDAVWGLFGANVVHFSFLLEFMAQKISVPMGKMYFMSNSLHLYTEVEVARRCLDQVQYIGEDYLDARPTPLFSDAELSGDFIYDCESLIDGTGVGNIHTTRYFAPRTRFFREIAVPMWNCFCLWKAGGRDEALRQIRLSRSSTKFPDPDWLIASEAWFTRRHPSS